MPCPSRSFRMPASVGPQPHRRCKAAPARTSRPTNRAPRRNADTKPADDMGSGRRSHFAPNLKRSGVLRPEGVCQSAPPPPSRCRRRGARSRDLATGRMLLLLLRWHAREGHDPAIPLPPLSCAQGRKRQVDTFPSLIALGSLPRSFARIERGERKPKPYDMTREAAVRRAVAATSEAGGRAPESGQDALIEGQAATARRTAAPPKPTYSPAAIRQSAKKQRPH
jgi:hypothetical protein